MKTLTVMSHPEFAIESLLPGAKELFARVGAAVWEAITSTGPKPCMAAGDMERDLSESTDTEGCARRLHAKDDSVVHRCSLSAFW
jgi:hypothetical protein